jgi:hypothetical protein
LLIGPLCRHCLERGLVTPATVADHIRSHGGDWNAFVMGELQSLCHGCHCQKLADQNRGFQLGTGLDGLPLDPNHPTYQPREWRPKRRRGHTDR